MTRYVLNFIYLMVLTALSPLLIYKAFRQGKYYRTMWRKLSGRTPRRAGNRPCVWFHGVSVGEVYLLRPLVAAFRQRHPDWDVAISTTTDTGFEEARKRFPDELLFFWPFDFTWAVRRALQRVRPNLVVLAESEMWPNFLGAAKRRNIPVALINGRMSPRTLKRYQKVGRLTRRLFAHLDLCAVQTAEYADHFRALGAPNVVVTGSVKYDNVLTDRDHPRTRELRRLYAVEPEDLVWVAGSTQPPEEQHALDIFRQARQQFPNLRLFLVPRQPERFSEVAALLEQAGQPFVRRSAMTGPLRERADVVLVDTLGELGALWGLADVAFVGGSMDGKRGGQNMIEPAGFGAAVLFGKFVWNFREPVLRLLEQSGAVQVNDARELEREVLRLLGDAAARQALGANAQRYVLAQRGATLATLDALDRLVTRCEERRVAA
jgi:3-deoxy-D-manno-octulosonic-acid transferase